MGHLEGMKKWLTYGWKMDFKMVVTSNFWHMLIFPSIPSGNLT